MSVVSNYSVYSGQQWAKNAVSKQNADGASLQTQSDTTDRQYVDVVSLRGAVLDITKFSPEFIASQPHDVVTYDRPMPTNLRDDSAALPAEHVARIAESRANRPPSLVDIFYPGAAEASRINKAQQEWDNNPLSRWDYNKGAEAYQGHDIMQWMTDDFVTVVSEDNNWGQKVTFGKFPVDEYGYSYNPPARYQGRPEQGLDVVQSRYLDDKYVEIHDKNPVKDAPASPNITLKTQDRVGLIGLTLEERKFFLDGVQQILDENNIDENARVLRYGGGITGPSWVDGKSGYLDNVMELIKENQGLMDLMLKSGNVKAGRTSNDTLFQEYRILVTDKSGNKLPGDQIIIESGNSQKQLQMSVEEFKNLDRTKITAMLA
ncbi:MAG: hypothetical protein ACRC2T_20110 [Thermoguttaceae bacterium]